MTKLLTKIKKPLLFALCLLPIALVAGIFTGIYQINTLDPEIMAEAVAQLGGTGILVAITAVQTAGYALFCGFFGYIIAEKLGLWKPLKVEKKHLTVTLAISVMGGIVFSLDHWVFGSIIDGIQEANASSLTASNVIASVLYGGIIEEVMLRLFFMSAIALVIWKLFFRKYDREHIPSGVFVAANIIAALAFAASHLPATLMIFGQITPLILFRCFLLNGGFGLIFGWLYRKYGLGCSIVSHAVFHIVSKLIWFIFI